MRAAITLLSCFLILFLIVLLNGMIKGVGPTVGADGWLKWDYTGFVSKQQNETERERIRQQNETERTRIREENWTERNEDGMQALQLIALAAAGLGIFWVVQHHTTEREAIRLQALRFPPPQPKAPQLPPVVNLYINYLIPGKQGKVIDVDGVPMIQDDSRQMLIPLDVAERELATLGLLPPPPSRRLTGPTIDGA